MVVQVPDFGHFRCQVNLQGESEEFAWCAAFLAQKVEDDYLLLVLLPSIEPDAVRALPLADHYVFPCATADGGTGGVPIQAFRLSSIKNLWRTDLLKSSELTK